MRMAVNGFRYIIADSYDFVKGGKTTILRKKQTGRFGEGGRHSFLFLKACGKEGE